MIIQVINDFFSQLANYFKRFKNIKLSSIFNDWNIFEILWLVISVTSLGIISILTTNDYLVVTTIATVTDMLNILLVAKGNILNYFFAFINNITYAYVCYSQGVYGQFLLFAFFFFPMQFYGLYTWTKPQNISENNSIITKTLSAKQRVYLVIVIIIAAYI